MNCLRVRDEIKAYIDGELGWVMRWRVARHIARCAECRSEMEIMTDLTKDVKGMPPVQTPEGLRNSVLGRLELKPAEHIRRWWPYRTRPVELAIVLVVTVVLGATILPIFSRARESARKTAAQANSHEAGVALKLEPTEPVAKSAPGSVSWRTSHGSRRDRMAESDQSSADSLTQPLPPYSQMIVKSADIGLRVDNFQKASAAAIYIARSAGGYVTDSSAASDVGTPTEGTLTLRVPANGFERTVERLCGLGKVRAKNLTGEDVTGEAVDFASRLRNKRAEEKQYLAIMDRSRRVPDIVTVTSELSRVRGEIEETQGRLQYLKSTAAMSTINLTLSEKEKPKPAPQGSIRQSFGDATASLMSTGSTILSLLIWLGVYSPFWALPIGALAYVRRRTAEAR